MSQHHFFELHQLEPQRSAASKRYLEFLRLPTMSAGLYVLPAGAADQQSPHKQDELYYVIRGKARMRVGEGDCAVAAGSLIFVEARAQHHFHDIEEELTALVFFAPAET